MSCGKCADSSANAAEEASAQRMRLNSSAAAADPPSAVRPPLSAAQSCADDPLTLAFGFIELKELAHAGRTCRAWLAAAAKEKPRGLHLWIIRAERLAALCASSLSLKKHISSADCSRSSCTLSLHHLAQMRQLPELTGLGVRLSAADLQRLMDEEGGAALAAVRAAFPPNLRELALSLPQAHSAATWQLLLQLDALPAMKELEELSLTPASEESAALSLEPLLQLPRLTHLTLGINGQTLAQLQIIKQISTLQDFKCFDEWTAAQLSSFCRPPHIVYPL